MGTGARAWLTDVDPTEAAAQLLGVGLPSFPRRGDWIGVIVLLPAPDSTGRHRPNKPPCWRPVGRCWYMGVLL